MIWHNELKKAVKNACPFLKDQLISETKYLTAKAKRLRELTRPVGTGTGTTSEANKPAHDIKKPRKLNETLNASIDHTSVITHCIGKDN